jgi:hypothetical protein
MAREKNDATGVWTKVEKLQKDKFPFGSAMLSCRSTNRLREKSAAQPAV